MSKLRLAVAALVVPLLTACATTGPDEGWGRVPKVGTRMTLNQDIVVPAGKSRVHIQYGKVVPHSQLNQPYPYCSFRLVRSKQELGTPQTILADEFIIEKVYRRVDMMSANTPFQVAQALILLTTNRDSAQTLAITMEIASPRQPEVTSFICAAWGIPDVFNYPSLGEIDNTLGEVITMYPPGTEG